MLLTLLQNKIVNKAAETLVGLTKNKIADKSVKPKLAPEVKQSHFEGIYVPVEQRQEIVNASAIIYNGTLKNTYSIKRLSYT